MVLCFKNSYFSAVTIETCASTTYSHVNFFYKIKSPTSEVVL